MSLCNQEDREHVSEDWKWIKDWFGNPDIPNGTQDCSHYECVHCGEEPDDNDSLPDEDEGF